MIGGPPSELRARVLAEIARTPSPTRKQHRRRLAMIVAAAVLMTASLFFAMGGMVRGGRPLDLVVLTAGSGLIGAAVMTRVSSSSSPIGRPRSQLLASAAGVAGAFVLVAVAAEMFWPVDAPLTVPLNVPLKVREAVPSSLDAGCAMMTVIQGLLPLAAMLTARRFSDPVHPMASGAALGMTAGAWAVAMAYLRCPHLGIVHCVLAHVLPTLVLTALGALLGRAVLRVRPV